MKRLLIAAALSSLTLGACTSATSVSNANMPVEAFAQQVARNAQHGMLDKIGPTQVLNSMRGDAGHVSSRGLRFTTHSSVPSSDKPIHKSFWDLCVAKGGKLELKPNPVTLPAPTRARKQNRKTKFIFCEIPGKAPAFAYSVFDTGERMQNYNRKLITVASDPGNGSALQAFARDLSK